MKACVFVLCRCLLVSFRWLRLYTLGTQPIISAIMLTCFCLFVRTEPSLLTQPTFVVLWALCQSQHALVVVRSMQRMWATTHAA